MLAKPVWIMVVSCNMLACTRTALREVFILRECCNACSRLAVWKGVGAVLQPYEIVQSHWIVWLPVLI